MMFDLRPQSNENRLKAPGTTSRTLLVSVFFALFTAQTAAAQASERTLFILLDAVPYSVVAEITDPALGADALFQDLKGPVRLVSAFPTSTSVALRGMFAEFGLGMSPGYEARYFDWEANKVRGGGPISYYQIDFPWRGFFDRTRVGPVRSSFQALHPIDASINQIKEALESFAESDKRVYWIYIAETDWVGHLSGPESLKEVFTALEAELREVRRRKSDRPFDVVIFSDHGMAGGEPLQYIWEAVRHAVEEAGYRYTRRLKGPTDVVLTPFGLLSNLEAYTHENLKGPVAEALAGAEGVDLCAYRRDASWAVVSSRGKAVFRRRTGPEGLHWTYVPETGDPLGYVPLIHRFQRETGREDAWLPDAAWFEMTIDGSYPDAFHRLTQAFELVENPASIVCSLCPGYMYGAPKTKNLSGLSGGKLQWTHGGLHHDATMAFLMSDVDEWDPPDAVRFDEAFLPFLHIVSETPRSD